MEKLLILVGLGQRAYGRWLFQRTLSGAVVVVGLVFITAIMISAALIAALCAIYYTLLSYQIAQLVALMITAIFVLLVIALLIILTQSYLQRLRQVPRALTKKSPLASHATSVIDAFVNGLMAE